jgi:KRAB domain-containing zinc finger protein
MSVPLDLLDHHQNCHPDESTSAVLQSESDPLTEAEDYQFCDVKPTLPIVGQLECNLISFGKASGQVRKNLKAARLKLELKSSRKLLASNQSIRPTETNNNSKQKALTDDCSNNTPQGVSHLLHNVKEDESNDQIQNPNTKKCKIKLKRNGFHNKKLKTTTIDPNTHAVHEPSKLKRKELNNKKLKTTTIDPNIHTVPEPPKLKRKGLQNKKVKTTIMDPNIHTAHEPPTCIHCSRTFVLKTSLANHINKIHNDSNPVPFMPYHCQLCYRNFSNRKSHHEHRRTKHPTDPNVLGHFQCSLCPKSFACQMEFHTHYNNGHPGLHFHCGDCKIKFATSKELDEHTTARQHRAQTDTCRLCDQNFATRVQRLEHQSSQHPNISDKHCLPCDRKFPTLIAFWRHVGQVHYKGKSFQCELCGNEFPNAEYLKSHQICFHKTGNRYQCQHCNDAFGFKSLLDKHLIRHHPEHAPNQVCKICKEEFKQLRLLRAHEFKVHNVTYRKSGLKMAGKEKRFCDICDKVFSTGAYLTTHKQTVHEKIKKFSCSICNKTFGTKLYLKAHMNGVHLKKILYKCKICQKDFTYSSNLSLHVKTQH